MNTLTFSRLAIQHPPGGHVTLPAAAAGLAPVEIGGAPAPVVSLYRTTTCGQHSNIALRWSHRAESCSFCLPAPPFPRAHSRA